MTDMKEILLIGGGGHCRSCIEVIESSKEFKIAGIIDRKHMVGQSILGYPVIGSDSNLKALREKYTYAIVTVGQIESNELRKKLFGKIQRLNYVLPVLIADSAHVSKHSNIGEGSIVMHQAFVNAGVSIGSNSIVNNGAIIEHDCVIGNHCHVSTNVTLNGGVKINHNTFIGSNSCIIQELKVASNVCVGANSTVMKNIARKGTYVGSPAQKIK